MRVSGDYARFYDGISAYGEGLLRVQDNKRYEKKDFDKNSGAVSFVLYDGITGVEKGFFDPFLTLCELVVPESVKEIGVTEATLEIFKKNRVTVRGVFDSYAERFAKKYRLRFLHADVKMASTGDYFERGNYSATIRFRPDGSAFLHLDCQCQGSSAGSTGGGETSVDLPRDFWKTATPDSLAEMCWGCLHGSVLESAALKTFLEKAKARGGCEVQY